MLDFKTGIAPSDDSFSVSKGGSDFCLLFCRSQCYSLCECQSNREGYSADPLVKD